MLFHDSEYPRRIKRPHLDPPPGWLSTSKKRMDGETQLAWHVVATRMQIPISREWVSNKPEWTFTLVNQTTPPTQPQGRERSKPGMACWALSLVKCLIVLSKRKSTQSVMSPRHDFLTTNAGRWWQWSTREPVERLRCTTWTIGSA